MSEPATAAPAAEPAAAPQGGAAPATPVTPAAEPAPQGGAAPTVIGGGTPQAAEPAPQGGASPDVNPYEAHFGQYFNADGTAKEGWTEQLPAELGLNEGRLARLGRQTSLHGVIKALSHAQDAIEKRDGAGEFIPDLSNENALRDYREQKGIPQDITDPQNSYDFNAGVDEGQVSAFTPELSEKLSPVFQKSNLSRDQAREVTGLVNEWYNNEIQTKKEAFEDEQSKRELDAYNQVKQEWGMEFEQKDQAVGRMHKTYEMDMNDPVDRAALTNPKVIRMMADLAAFSKVTDATPESGVAGDGSHALSPAQQAQQMMKDNPNWKNETTLRTKIEGLFKQSAAMKR